MTRSSCITWNGKNPLHSVGEYNKASDIISYISIIKNGAVSEMIFKIISVDGLFIFYSYIYMKLFLNEQVF